MSLPVNKIALSEFNAEERRFLSLSVDGILSGKTDNQIQLQGLKDPDPRVRQVAVEELPIRFPHMGFKDRWLALADLEELARSEEDEEIRAYAIIALIRDERDSVGAQQFRIDQSRAIYPHLSPELQESFESAAKSNGFVIP